MTNRIISAVNSDGIFSFDSNAYLSTNSKSININSKSVCNIISQKETIIESSKLNLKSINEPLILESKSNNTKLNNSSIQLNSFNGSIKLNAKQQNINTLDGDINMNSTNGSINIGYIKNDDTSNHDNVNIESLTQNIELESLRKISLNSEDIYGIASDSIHFISQSGDITFGSQLDKPFLSFDNDNLILNQQSSSTNRILDINVDKPDTINSYKTNGLFIKSSNPSISSDVCCQNDKKNSINIGITSSNSNQYHLYEKQLIGYQKDNIIYNLGPYYLTKKDINKSYIWGNNNTNNNNTNNNSNNSEISNQYIKSINSYNIILKQQNSNFNIQVELTESFNINNNYNELIKEYIIKIDKSTNNNYTFKWKYKNDSNFLKENTNIKITKEPTYIDCKQIKIIFSVINGFEPTDYWIYKPIQILNSTSNNNTELNYNYFYLLNSVDQLSYISTNNNDLSINTYEPLTKNNSSLYIKKDGNVSINTSSLNLNQIEYNNSVSCIDTNKIRQSSYDIVSLNTGEYIVVWTETTVDNKYSNIYKQMYLSNGCKLSEKTLINTNKNSGIHENPSVSLIHNINNNYNDNYLVVWSSPENDSIYSIYGHIYINNKKKKNFDIPIDRFYNNKNDICLTSCGLSNDTFLILWCGADNNVNYFSCYGLLLDLNGNIVKNKFQISHQNPLNNIFNPIILDITNNNIVVFYHIKSLLDHNDKTMDVNKYDIYYNIIDYHGTVKLSNDIPLKQKLLLNTPNPISISKQVDNTFFISCYNNISTSINLYIKYLNNKTKVISTQNHSYSIDLYDNLFMVKSKVKKIINNIIELEDDNKLTYKINDKLNIVINDTYIFKVNIINVTENTLIFSTDNITHDIYKYCYCNYNNNIGTNIHEIKLLDIKPHINNIECLNSNINEHSIILTNKNDLFISRITQNKIYYNLLSFDLQSIIIFDKELNNTQYNEKRLLKSKEIYLVDNKNQILLLWISNNNIIKQNIINIYNYIFNIETKENNFSLTPLNNVIINNNDNDNQLPYLTSKLIINGSLSTNIKTISNMYYKPSDNDYTILCNTTDNNVTILLNNNHTLKGRRYIIKNVSSIDNNSPNKVIVRTLFKGYIDNKKQIELNNMNSIEIQTDGNDWYIINSFINNY
jgi:hypothetical protein